MRKSTKVWLTIAIALILTGCILFGGAMTMLNGKFDGLSTVAYQTIETVVEDEFTDICLNGSTADVSILPAQDGKAKVVCHEQVHLAHTVAVKNGVLTIEEKDTRKWYHHIGISFEKTAVTVYLPRDTYGKLSVKLSTGDISVGKYFNFTDVDLSVSTGDVRLQDLTAETVAVGTSTGDVSADHINIQGEFSVKINTGKTDVTDTVCGAFSSEGNTGDLDLKNLTVIGKMSIKRTTGDVSFDKCDAAEMLVTTSTGNVKGSLRSDKVFLAQSRTGRVDVPHSTDGGRCEITTSTGDIRLTVES